MVEEDTGSDSVKASDIITDSAISDLCIDSASGAMDSAKAMGVSKLLQSVAFI